MRALPARPGGGGGGMGAAGDLASRRPLWRPGGVGAHGPARPRIAPAGPLVSWPAARFGSRSAGAELPGAARPTRPLGGGGLKAAREAGGGARWGAG